MKKILFNSIPYFICFIIINLICLKTSNFFSQEKKYLDRIDSSIEQKSELVFLGDSHAESIRHINPDQELGNLAFGADGINEMYIKSLITIMYNPDVKYVFLCTEPQMFNNSVSPNNSFLNPYLLKINDPLNIYDKNKLDYLVEKTPLFNDNYLKFYLNKVFNSLKGSGNKNIKAWKELSETEKKIIASKTGKIDHIGILANKKDTMVFKKMIDLYKSRNIKIIGIRYPVYEDYLNQCDKNDLVKVNDFLKGLNLYHNLDYSFAIQDPTLFADEDHLNKKGMKKLAELIYRDTGIDLMK